MHLKTSAETFLAIKEAKNYRETVQELMSSYSAVGLTCHGKSAFPLGLFSPENMGAISSEHG